MNYTLKFKILILVLGPTLCWTQNLIQNGSFEITTGCPDDFDQFEKAAYWKTKAGWSDWSWRL